MTQHPADQPERDLSSPDDLGEALRLLRRGSLELVGRLVDASNATFLGSVELNGVSAECVYKPVKGERPLWDFPTGTLANREVGAYAVSEATGWRIVPPTVMRAEGPFGRGMCQLWVDGDPGVDLVALVRGAPPELRRMAVFDAIVNNTDRKGGHLIPTSDGHVYGVDHGICFSVEDKLRTVLWQWAGDPLADEARDVLERLDADLRGGGRLASRLRRLLSEEEVAATRMRVRRMLATGCHPMPPDDWHAVPWPPF